MPGTASHYQKPDEGQATESPSEPPEGASHAHTSILDFQSPALRVSFGHGTPPGCSILLQRLWETHTEREDQVGQVPTADDKEVGYYEQQPPTHGWREGKSYALKKEERIY